MNNSDDFYVDNIQIEVCNPDPVAEDLAYFQMDETSWNGTSNEVVDSSGNSNHGTAIGNANTVDPGKVCLGADIPFNDTDGTQDAVDTGLDLDSDIGTTGTIAFWYQPDTNWNGGGDRMLVDASTTADNKYFFVALLNTGVLRFRIEDSSDADFQLDTSAKSFSAGDWHHIAITWDLPGDRMEIYIDGTLDSTLTQNTSGSWGALGTVYLGDNRSTYHPLGTPNSANGVIDEVYIYNAVRSTSEIQIDKDATHTCAVPSLDHFDINVGTGATNACSAFPITITAEDSSNGAITDYTGTVAITTSTSNGNFGTGSPTPTNSLNPNPDNDDNGSVGYTFDSADNGVIALTISNPHIESLTISVNDASASVTSTSSSITFAEAGFSITDVDSNALAATGLVVANRDHAFRITALRLDPVNGCGTASGYDGVKNLKLWRTQNGADPSTVDPALAGYSLPNSEAGSTSSVTFSGGIANVSLAATDIGKYVINVADRTGTFTAADMTGSSSEQTVMPFGIGVTGIIAGATTNPANAGSGGTIFTSAGSDFSATVSGVLWSAADDINGDGVLDTGSYNDNTVAPGYDWNSPWTISSFTPATGTVGILTNATFSQGGFSSGTPGAQTVANLTYDEVGSFTFQANGSNFLGTPGADFASDTTIVGRFVPATFSVSDNADGVLDDVCTSFTYIGQPFGYSTAPTFVVTALNAGLNPTGNYRDAWAKLGVSGITVTAVTQDDSNSLVVNQSPVAMDSATAANDDSGQVNYTFGADTFRYGPATPTTFAKFSNSRISPFTADITPVITNVNDGEVSGITASENVNLTGNNLRFGRLRMMNVHGSEISPLSMTVRAEYWDGVSSTFQLNTLDNCTTIAYPPDLIVSDNLNSGSSTITINNPTASVGDIGYGFSAPGDGNDGYIDVTTDLSTSGDLWLRFDWDSDGEFDDDPTARATFGIFEGSPVRSYIQQIYP